MDSILQEIIDDHRNEKRSMLRKAAGNEDLVDVLLKFQQEQEQEQYALTDDNIKAVIQVSL